IDGEVGAASEGPLALAGARIIPRLEQAERAADRGVAGVGHDEEVRRRQDAAAWPHVVIQGAAARLIRSHPGSVAPRSSPHDVAIVEQMGSGLREALVLRAAVEQRAGDLGGENARLSSAVVVLRDLKVAVAAACREEVFVGAQAGYPLVRIPDADTGIERAV